MGPKKGQKTNNDQISLKFGTLIVWMNTSWMLIIVFLKKNNFWALGTHFGPKKGRITKNGQISLKLGTLIV